MTRIGEKLRAVRLERGISLQEISDETKIAPRYLEAVETGDNSVLPGAVFARNFARQYANYLGVQNLGLKSGELDEAIRNAFPPEAEPVPAQVGSVVAPTFAREPIEVAPLSDAWNWQRIGVSAAALLAVLAVGAGIYRVWQSAPGLIESARTQASEVMSSSQPVSTQVSNMPSVSVDSQTTENANGEPVSETTITISGSGMAVRLVAEQDTWVSMTANGEHVFSELIKANESRTISGVENARMVIGNAGGLKIATNGKDIGPIGLPGQVREVRLSPEGAKIGAPAI